MELLNYYNDIPIGRENAVTRKALQAKWDMSERAVRKMIQELRIRKGVQDVIL